MSRSTELIFECLNAEQMKRFDPNFGCRVSNQSVFAQEPNVLNALELVENSAGVSDNDYKLASEMFRNVSNIGKITFVECLAKTVRLRSNFYERYIRILREIYPDMSKIYIARRNFFTRRPVRRSSYVGRFPEVMKTFVAKYDMLTDKDLIRAGSSFILRSYIGLEHGAIDADVDTPSGGQKMVILFPDEINLIATRSNKLT